MPGNALSGKSWSNTPVVGALKVRNLVARQTLMPTHCRDDLMPYRCVFSPCKNRLPTVLHTFYARSLFQEPDSLSARWFCRARIRSSSAILHSYHRIDSSSARFRIRTNVLRNLSAKFLSCDWFRFGFFFHIYIYKIIQSDLLIERVRFILIRLIFNNLVKLDNLKT